MSLIASRPRPHQWVRLRRRGADARPGAVRRAAAVRGGPAGAAVPGGGGRLLPVWAPALVLAGFLAIAVNLNLLPVGAALVLAGLLPLRVTPRPVA
ncbi:hypothetical protein V2I01_20680 [Micromonospora sp. BRA006-A]|nr:hypothetical protein [Micromonospora sp. BRA006-A]